MIADFAKTGFLVIFVVVGFSLAFGGSGKDHNPNDWPVEHWLDDPDECVRMSAKAISDSGLPYPNFTKSDDGSIAKKDMWVAGVRFVIPANLGNTLGYPEHHPMRHVGMMGTISDFTPNEKAVQSVDEVGPSVFVRISCSLESRYLKSWGRGYKSNEEGIEAKKKSYRQELGAAGKSGAEVLVVARQDIGMTEVIKNDGLRQVATYWPLRGEMRSPSGNVSGIECNGRNLPRGEHYAGVVECESTISYMPGIVATVTVYAPFVAYMPSVYDQIIEILDKAKREGEVR